MNSQYGLEYVLEQEDASELLKVPLMSQCPQVRKIMFEILAAISLYKGKMEKIEFSKI